MILLFIFYLDYWTNLKKNSILRGTSEDIPFLFFQQKGQYFCVKKNYEIIFNNLK